MDFSTWHDLTPAAAARRMHAAVAALPPGQRRAAVASLPDEATLSARFAATDPKAPLGRLPYFAKDLYDVAGEPTRAGSAFLAEVRPTPARDSALIVRLRELGAVLAGKSHLHEFAYGLTGENPHYGDCEHPRFPGRTSGGSSSGSAALVAAGVVPFALGTDTGCSLRLPAAFCGLYSLRLTPGEAWIRDVLPLAPSFDTAGWFTATAADMRHALGALVGWRVAQREPRGVYVEWPGLEPEVAAICRRAAGEFAAIADAAMICDIHAGLAPAADAYGVIVGHEALAGHRAWFPAFAPRYDPNVRARLEAAVQLTTAQVDSARASMTAVRLKWTQLFLSFDFVVLPAAPFPALTKADCTAANRRRILDLNAPASLGGLPVLTVPVPLAGGLSAGLQIIVNHPQSPVLPWLLGR